MSFISIAKSKVNEPLKAFDLVLEIDGVENVYASSTILDLIRIGDPGLFFDGTWLIGGARAVDNQSDEPLLSLDDSTTTIASSVEPDEAKGTSVEFMKIGLIDKDQEITNLISPGVVVEDILGLDTKVWIGFQGTYFTRDYLPIFRGLITDVNSATGIIYLSLSSGEEKKRQKMIFEFESVLSSSINDTVTTIPVDTTNDYLVPITGPDTTIDASFKSYIEVNDEIMEVSAKTSTEFTVTRGVLGSVAVSHTSGDDVTGLYIIEGNPIDLALKLMLSRGGGNYLEDLEISKIGVKSDNTVNSNVVLFIDRNLVLEENIRVGDYLTITDSTNSNDRTLSVISQITETNTGTEVYISGNFNIEVDSTAKAAFRSQYDVFPTQLGLTNDDVDIEKHEFYRTTFFPSIEFKFYVRDEIEGKDWLDDEIYKPCAMYSLSNNGRASVGYHFPPLPNVNIQILDQNVIKNAEELSILRSINRNFYNTIVYKYNDSLLESDLTRTVINIDSTSVARIGVGPRSLDIESLGMKESLGGAAFANQQATRRLSRYKFGAEQISDVDVFINTAFQSNLGDTVLLDGDNLNLADSLNATRKFKPRLMEVTEKSLNIVNGAASFTLLDTGFGLDNTFFLMSPASPVKAFGSAGGPITNRVVFSNSLDKDPEWTKWAKYKSYGIKIRIRGNGVTEPATVSDIFTIQTVEETTGVLVTVEEITLGNATSKIVEFAPYNDQTSENIEAVKQIFGWMNDTSFTDGRSQYQMI